MTLDFLLVQEHNVKLLKTVLDESDGLFPNLQMKTSPEDNFAL